MLKKYALAFYEIGQALKHLEAGVHFKAGRRDGKDFDHLDDGLIAATRRNLEGIEHDAQNVGLVLSAKMARRILDKSDSDYTYSQLVHLIRELQRRIEDELDAVKLLLVTPQKVEVYEGAYPFGETVAQKFSVASFDIEEAAKCFALDRSTACVMHLMRALEVALDAIGLGVGISNAVIDARNSWEKLFRQIDKQIEINDKIGDLTWQAKRQFFVDAEAHLYSVKNAWRNPSMHLEKKYDDREAERIFRAVKDFMEHLSTHLDQSGHLS